MLSIVSAAVLAVVSTLATGAAGSALKWMIGDPPLKVHATETRLISPYGLGGELGAKYHAISESQGACHVDRPERNIGRCFVKDDVLVPCWFPSFLEGGRGEAACPSAPWGHDVRIVHYPQREEGWIDTGDRNADQTEGASDEDPSRKVAYPEGIEIQDPRDRSKFMRCSVIYGAGVWFTSLRANYMCHDSNDSRTDYETSVGYLFGKPEKRNGSPWLILFSMDGSELSKAPVKTVWY